MNSAYSQTKSFKMRQSAYIFGTNNVTKLPMNFFLQLPTYYLIHYFQHIFSSWFKFTCLSLNLCGVST